METVRPFTVISFPNCKWILCIYRCITSALLHFFFASLSLSLSLTFSLLSSYFYFMITIILMFEIYINSFFVSFFLLLNSFADCLSDCTICKCSSHLQFFSFFKFIWEFFFLRHTLSIYQFFQSNNLIKHSITFI